LKIQFGQQKKENFTLILKIITKRQIKSPEKSNYRSMDKPNTGKTLNLIRYMGKTCFRNFLLNFNQQFRNQFNFLEFWNYVVNFQRFLKNIFFGNLKKCRGQNSTFCQLSWQLVKNWQIFKRFAWIKILFIWKYLSISVKLQRVPDSRLKKTSGYPPLIFIIDS